MFLSASAPLPDNSAVAPGVPAIDDNSVAAIAAASREGRQRVYANLPTLESLWSVSPGTAVDAAQLIAQSETARESVLIGVTPLPYPDPTLADILASAPQVNSVNGTPVTALSNAQSGLMPAPAPTDCGGGLWQSPKVPGADQNQRLARATRAGGPVASTPALGPGCVMPPLPRPAAVPVLPPLPAAAVPVLSPPDPYLTRPGMGNYGPVWGDAWGTGANTVPAGGAGDWVIWALLGLGAVAVFYRRGRR